jgi:branched-chain amino acid transport system ATP-binding protein
MGPNGAGKTTLLHMLSGMLAPSRGRILFRGKDITRLSPQARCHLGLGRAFQVVQPFFEMTVEENVRVGALFGSPGVSAAQGQAVTEWALEQCGLTNIRDKYAEDLTLMQDKRLEIARALATQQTKLVLAVDSSHLQVRQASFSIALARIIDARSPV